MEENTSQQSPVPRKGKKILIIEDDFYIRDLYVQQALLMGYDVISACDGIEGLDKIVNQKPDLVILDLMIPLVNGLKILHKIRETPELSTLPVIVFTNIEDSVKEEEVKKLGVLDYFTKLMVTPEKIMQRVNDYFNPGRQ